METLIRPLAHRWVSHDGSQESIQLMESDELNQQNHFYRWIIENIIMLSRNDSRQKSLDFYKLRDS